jgi:hypothetical protein
VIVASYGTINSPGFGPSTASQMQRLIEVAERDKKPVDELRALRHSASK